MPEHRAASLSELTDNTPTEVDLGPRKVVLVRMGDAVHAVAATCPHKGVPLAKGAVRDGRIVCPAHRAMFDLSTGDVLAPPACEGIATYAVRLDGDDVMVEIDETTEEHPRPVRPGTGEDERHFVIVGSGAAGWYAAETLRREGFDGRITVVTDEGRTPLDRTVFSKGYLTKEGDADAPALRSDEGIRDLGIEIHEGRAEAIDGNGHKITVGGKDLSYDKLLIATGSRSRQMNVPGADLEGIHTIRTLGDADALRRDLAERRETGTCRVAIVGGGFIGLEAAAALGDLEGVEITVLLREDVPVAGIFGEAFGKRILEEQRAAGVTMVTGAQVSGFSGETRVDEVTREDGDPVACDLVILAIGAVPNTDWLPFATGEDGGIDVTADLSLSDHPDIYLAGDIARVPTDWGPLRIEHWRFAQETGALAARNMLGQNRTYDGTPFFWTMQQPDGSYTYTGHAADWDSVLGTPEGDKFAMSYLEGDRVTAVLALGFDDRATLAEPRMAGRGGLDRSDAVAY